MKLFFSQVILLIWKMYSNSQVWIMAIAIGVWLIVFQNFGVFSKEKSLSVYVVGGDIDANVCGSVDVDNTVDVNVDNMIDVNLQAINGYSNCFYNNYYRHPKDYYRIPVDY